MEPCRPAEVFKRCLEEDVGSLGRSTSTFLKAAFTEDDTAVCTDILHLAVEGVNDLPRDGLRPELAFDNPTALVGELRKGDIHVDLVFAARALHGLFYVCIAAEVSEDHRRGLLIVMPASVFRAHWE